METEEAREGFRGGGGRLRDRIDRLFAAKAEELAGSPEFRALEGGRLSRDQYDRFLENVIRAHVRSPKLVAFLYALAPPDAADDLLHNLLEELGLDEASKVAHPTLLRALGIGAGLGSRLPALETLADDDLRQAVLDPLLFGSLRDVGLAALGEIIAFEYMLARVAGRIARALAAHRGLDAETLQWFTYHSEVDVRHAEQGLDVIEAYVRYYGMAEEDALSLLEVALRDNPFVKRYFRAIERRRRPARIVA